MFYLIIFVILTILAVLNIIRADKSGNRILIGIAALILILVAGLRYETGGDWPNYKILFTRIPTIQHLDLIHNDYHRYCEIGFCILCSLIKTLGGDIQTFFFVICAVNITFITCALCRYTKYPVLGLLCYYGILYFSLEMIYIRQAMAVAICFWAIHYIIDRCPIQYIIWILIACSLHRMAIVMLLLYPLIRFKIPTWAYAAVVGIGAIIMLANVTWISNIFLAVTSWIGGGFEEKARIYTEAGMFSVNRKLSVGFILNLAILAVILFQKKTLDELKYGTIHLNMFVLSLMLYYYCYELVEVSNRFRLFFLISVIAILPMLAECMQLRSKKIVATIVIILYAFSFSQGIFLENPQAAAYNPYQNYIVYKIQHKASTGKVRLEQSNRAFRLGRRK